MSKFMRGLGSFIAIAGGLLGFVLSMLVVFQIVGSGGLIVSILIFPFTFALVPLYTLIVYGSWNLLLINYGSMAIGWALHRMADNMEKPPQALQADPAVKPVAEKNPKGNPAPAVILLVAGGLILAAVISAGSGSTPDPTPTRAPTLKITATKTQRPPPTRTPRPVLHACVTDASIRVRQGPGTEHGVIGGLASGTCMSVSGRNQDSTWVYMIADDNTTGWVAAWLLTVDGDLGRLSVRSAAAASGLAPTQALGLGPTQKLQPTATHKQILLSTSTPRPVIIQPTAKNNNCSPAYPGVCIPPRPPDLDCKDVPYRRFTVLSPDPHGFDADGDGIGCES